MVCWFDENTVCTSVSVLEESENSRLATTISSIVRPENNFAVNERPLTAPTPPNGAVLFGFTHYVSLALLQVNGH